MVFLLVWSPFVLHLAVARPHSYYNSGRFIFPHRQKAIPKTRRWQDSTVHKPDAYSKKTNRRPGKYCRVCGLSVFRFAEYKEGRQPFPHEMGVFLGYPLGDVKGFIEHHGKEYLCSGYWKVYQDEQKAKSTFQLYQSVRDAVLQLIMAGSNLYEISYQA